MAMDKRNEGGEETPAEGGWEDEKRDMKVQRQSCKDTLTMARIHQANRMVKREREREGANVRGGNYTAGTDNLSCNTTVKRHLQPQMFTSIIICFAMTLKALKTSFLNQLLAVIFSQVNSSQNFL